MGEITKAVTRFGDDWRFSLGYSVDCEYRGKQPIGNAYVRQMDTDVNHFRDIEKMRMCTIYGRVR